MKINHGLLSLLLIWFVAMPTITTASDTDQPNNRWKHHATAILNGTLTKQSIQTTNLSQLNYWLYTPENAIASMPLIIYLHGGSSRGNDLDLLTANAGFPKYVKDGQITSIPAYIIMPQLGSSFQRWTDIQDSLAELISVITDTYQIDSTKISLTGHSMGGTGVWSIALAYPTLFSCIAPLSGSVRVTQTNVNTLVGMPVWALVGSADTIVDPAASIQFIQQLEEQQSPATLTIFEGVTHVDVPQHAYLNDQLDLVGWLIAGGRISSASYQIAIPFVTR